MKLLLIDLDDSLIHTSKAKELLLQSIAKSTKTPFKEVEALYESLKNLPLEEDWELRLAQLLHAKTGIDPAHIMALIDKNIQQIEINIPILRYLKTFDGYKVLYSFGRRGFQEKKIRLLGIKELVNEIIITA